MKKIVFLFTVICSFVFLLSISANAVEPLPEDEIAYGLTCPKCNGKFARDDEPTKPYGSCGYSNCDGEFAFYTLCSKEYYYEVDCDTCDWEYSFDEYPFMLNSSPLEVCPMCNNANIEDTYRITYKYSQYERICTFCFNVLVGPSSIENETNCPYCGECYDLDPGKTVDENGNLIYGGGGKNLFYCTEQKIFYEPGVDENGNDYSTCTICNNHDANKITVLYSADCPECGTRATYRYLDYFKRPYMAGTINNAFLSIGMKELGFSVDSEDVDLTCRCLECKYDFSKDTDLKIIRYVDAPDEAYYEKHENDRDYHESDRYKQYGSEYDSFFEKLSWHFQRILDFFRNLFKR